MLLLFILACEQEEESIIEQQTENDYGFKIEEVSFEELKKDDSFRDKIEKIASVFDMNRNNNALQKSRCNNC